MTNSVGNQDRERSGQTMRNYCETIPPLRLATYLLPGHTTNSIERKAIALLLLLMRMGMIKFYSNDRQQNFQPEAER